MDSIRFCKGEFRSVKACNHCYMPFGRLPRRRGNVVTGAWQRCYGGVATLLRGRGNVVRGPWQRCYGAVATDELPCRNANVPCENGFVRVGDGRKELGLSGIGCFLGRALMLSVFFASHMRTEARWVAEKRCKGSVHEGGGWCWDGAECRRRATCSSGCHEV